MKVIAKLFGTLIKAVLALLILALLTPALYFAWRANQPMDMPEFKGLTFVQYEDWRKMIYEKNEDEFALAHPNRIVKQGVCFKADLTIQAVGVTLVSGSLFGSLLLPKNRERPVSMIDHLGLAAVAWNMIEGTLAVMPVGRNNLLPPDWPWCNMKSASRVWKRWRVNWELSAWFVSYNSLKRDMATTPKTAINGWTIKTWTPSSSGFRKSGKPTKEPNSQNDASR